MPSTLATRTNVPTARLVASNAQRPLASNPLISRNQQSTSSVVCLPDPIHSSLTTSSDHVAEINDSGVYLPVRNMRLCAPAQSPANTKSSAIAAREEDQLLVHQVVNVILETPQGSV